MWIYPSMTGSLVRSSWKTIDMSTECPFIVQRNDQAIAGAHLPAKKPGSPLGNTAPSAAYRIITQRFPHYKVAEASSGEEIRQDLEQLRRSVAPRITGKATAKKFVKWLRNWHLHGEQILSSTPETKDCSESGSSVDSQFPCIVAEECSPTTDTCSANRSTKYSRIETGYTSEEENDDDDDDDDDDDMEYGASTFSIDKSGVTAIRNSDTCRPSSLQAIPTMRQRSDTDVLSRFDFNGRNDSMLRVKQEHHGHKRSLSAGNYPAVPKQPVHASSMSVGKTRLRPRYPPPLTFPAPHATTNTDNVHIVRDEQIEGGSIASSSWGPVESLARLATEAGFDAQYITTLAGYDDGGGGAYPPPAMPSPATPGRKRANSYSVNGAAANGSANALGTAGIEQLWEFPLQFVALLTMPDYDPATERPSYQLLRDIAQVRQRRRVLAYFTAFVLVARYCSFDLFLLVLFASNCGLLFLMKNSRQINMTMAKRSVRQRVNWTKQWLGGLLRGRGYNHGQPVITETGAPATAAASEPPSPLYSPQPAATSRAQAVKRRLRLRGRGTSNGVNVPSDGVSSTVIASAAALALPAEHASGSVSDPQLSYAMPAKLHGGAQHVDDARLLGADTASTPSALSGSTRRLPFFRSRSPSHPTTPPTPVADPSSMLASSSAAAKSAVATALASGTQYASSSGVKHERADSAGGTGNGLMISASAPLPAVSSEPSSPSFYSLAMRRRFLFGRHTSNNTTTPSEHAQEAATTAGPSPLAVYPALTVPLSPSTHQRT